MSKTSERTFYIYCHIAPNGKRYIGQTCQTLDARWKNGEGYKACVLFTRAISKYGWESFKHVILCVVHSLKVANLFECYYIEKYHSNDNDYGYNLTSGGSLGYQFRDDVREKIREKAKIRGISPEHQKKMLEARARVGWHGYTFTEEQKKAVSERMSGANHPFYGKKLPREWVEKRVTSVRGRKASLETRKRQSEGLRNSEKVKAKRIPVLQFDGDGNLIERHESLSEAARKLGVSKHGIRHVCVGTCDTAYGYHWEYDDDALRQAADFNRSKRRDKTTIGLPVVQLDLNGNEIARFRSTVDASKSTGIRRCLISNCCRGKQQTSHGYKFQYIL